MRKELDFANLPALTEAEDERTVGLPVYEKLAVLNENGVDGYRERVFYYDSKGRAIQRVECDEDGDNLLRISNKYDFAGNIVAQRESYTYGGKTDDLDRTFSYDTRDRLVKETARLNNGEQAVVNHTYDDLGQLTGKTYGTGVYAIHETMDYNIQGWLTEKSSELFEMNLRYFDPRRDWVAASYTGNITEWKWQHKQVDGATLCDDYTYAYTYDDLGRLQSADLYSRDDDTLDGAVSGFSERMSYDKNSNILTLNRQGSPDENVQSYGFEYIGNQRTKERNSNSSYGYDANGNMTEDALTGFGMSYNILNLPEYIQDNWGSGEISHRYSYLADGTKTSVGDYENSGYQYAGSLVYSMDYGTVNSFESASFGGGRIVGTNDGTSSEVHYFLTDHLGSTRVVAKVTPTGREDLDRKDYYPFGKEWAQPDMPTSDNRYTFSGKEKQHLRFQEIDYADFGARFYDSEGVMFLQQDPMSEKYYPIGQYNYCLGNPIRLIDPNGMETTDALEEWIEELEKEIDDMRRRNNAEIARYEAGRTAKNSKRTDRKIKKAEARNARLDQVTKEIAALRDSDQLYGITISNGNDGNGAFVYNEEAGTMDVLIPADSPLGLFAHELKHAYQFEKGELGANPLGKGSNFLYDLTDEETAYERGEMFGHYVSDWKGRDSYKGLPSQSITVYSANGFTPFSNEYTYQSAADKHYIAFRINNKTYLPKKK